MKMKTLLPAVLALCFCLLLAGCGKATQDLPAVETTPAAEAAPSAEPAASAPKEEVAAPSAEPEVKAAEESAAPAPAPEPEPEPEEEVSPFLGTWKPYSQEGSISISHDQLVEMGYADQMSITFDADGTSTLYMFGMTSRESWTDSGDGSGTATVSGETYPITIENGMLAMDMGTYVAYYENAERPSGGVPVPEPKAVENDTVKLPLKSEAPALPFTLSNGLKIDELSVVLAGGRMWSFGYALENSTGSVQSFDPSKFVLRNADGTAVSTYASYLSADEVKPGVPLRTSVNIGTKDALNLGDEIYFFYDGIFLGTAVAREF